MLLPQHEPYNGQLPSFLHLQLQPALMADETALLDEYNGSSLVITAIILLVLTWMSVTLRTYVRGFMTNSFQLDDILMLVAQVCTGTKQIVAMGRDVDGHLTRPTSHFLVSSYYSVLRLA